MDNDLKKPYLTTVMTAATGYYHIFVLPYAASYHYFNPDSRFEFFVDDPDEFESIYADGLLKLRERLGDENLIISSLDINHLHPNHHQAVPRFFQTPEIETEFIYIGDVDVLILDSMITEQHKLNMEKNNLPFSNVIRKSTSNEIRPRLTGLHFSRYEAYYPLPLEKINQDDQIELDEFALHELVRAKIGDFEIKNNFRPPHGFHFSDKLDYWNSTSSMQVGLHLNYLPNYQLLRKTEYWRDMKSYFSEIFLTWLECLDRTMEVVWPNSTQLPIIKPIFEDDKWIGPGMNKDVDIIRGVRLARHQFLQTKSQQDSHLGKGSGAGEIFDFIEWCNENKIHSLLTITELTPIFITTILRLFKNIKMLVITPAKYDSDVFQFNNGMTNSELVKIEKISELSNEIINAKRDMIIIQPTQDDMKYNFSNCLDEIRIGIDNGVRYFGVVTANIPTEVNISTDIGTLHNFDLRHDLIPTKSFCLNNKILKMVTGFGKNVVSKETRVYLKIYKINEIDKIKPDENEIPLLKDFIDLFKEGKYNEFNNLFEIFHNRFENMMGLKAMAVRSYYLSNKYQKCIDNCDAWGEWPNDPIVALFKARAQRNSGLVDEAIKTYLHQLKIQPDNSNSLIECVRAMMGQNLYKESEKIIAMYIEQTRDKNAVGELSKILDLKKNKER